MFVRLTRHTRRKAGWFAALLYLFCVLAPGVALALGDAASCLSVETTAVAHVHEAMSDAAGSSHHHHDMQASQHADSGAAPHDHTRHEHNGKNSPGPCCAMLCLSGITADLPLIAKPSQPISVCSFTNFQRLPNAAPERHYRPPIA